MSAAETVPRRIDGLTMLRGLAIGLVLLRHSFPGVFGGAGLVGVVVFFALSGHLITGVLLRGLERTDRLDLRRFYLHRALRLLPALVVLLVVFVVVTLVWEPIPRDRTRVVRSVVLALTYVIDLPWFPRPSPGLSHLWTLAVEEQFYLLWPALLALATRAARPRRALVALLVVAGSTLWLASLVTVLSVERVRDVYPWPTSWGVVMVVGAASAVAGARLDRLLPPSARRTVLAAAVALVVLLGLSLPDLRDEPLAYLLVGPVIGVATVVLIQAARARPHVRSAPARLLVGLGTISYAAYLWNYLLVRWVSPFRDPEGLDALLVLVLTLAVATASWQLVEGPVQRWRVRRGI
ncbi:acyltransferase [Nocardioides sp. TRM66260-LWL]|uniref:acyltransferase family protein n=1 Tax=Nocardioides sp. TRM66260-LWL TaxID=2874478 RepID=UPI001CC4C571|nr:acyltransferase [Nocardioides sp. TRM66260-LWL]MBZ5734919.1 acyltransferase [Nocardioides sp. TRM66260-LWL]